MDIIILYKFILHITILKLTKIIFLENNGRTNKNILLL